MKYKLVKPFVLSALLLSACSKNDGTPPTAAAAPVDPVVAEKWCSVVTMVPGFQIIERYSFQGANDKNEVGIEYFTLDAGSQPKLYQAPWKSSWSKGTEPFMGYSVELSAKDTGKSGEEVDQLEKVQSTLQTRYPSLKKPLQNLGSVDTLKITHSDFMSSKSYAKTAFPCSSISASFAATEPTNPFIELSVLLYQVSSATISKSFAEQAIFLAAPITPLRAQDEELAGTNWCAIRYSSESFIWFDVLAFGEKRFVSSSAGTFSKLYPNERPRENSRSLDTSETSMFEIVSMDGGVLGERPSPWIKDAKDQSYFTLARDGRGVRALMRGSDFRRSPLLSTSFSDTFFDCSKPLPDTLEKEYGPRLLHFVTRLREKL